MEAGAEVRAAFQTNLTSLFFLMADECGRVACRERREQSAAAGGADGGARPEPRGAGTESGEEASARGRTQLRLGQLGQLRLGAMADPSPLTPCLQVLA